MSHSGWMIVRWLVGVIGGLGGLAMVVVSARGLMGGSTTSRLECDRASGTCRIKFPLRTRRVKLADIRGVELAESSAGLGRGAQVETQHGVVLRLADGDQYLASASGDPATVERYRGIAAQVQAFLSGTAPTLDLAIEQQSSRAMSLRYLFDGGLVLALTGAALVLMRHR